MRAREEREFGRESWPADQVERWPIDLTDPDDAPEAPEHPVSRTGDLWLLGAEFAANRRHRLR